jgi:hypothetical protein
MEKQQNRRRSLVPAVILVVLSAATVGWAQGAVTEAPGSIAALTAEVKQLRLAVEASSRVQAQTQALSVYLSAQQSRMVHLGQQLDAVRRDLPGATAANLAAASATKLMGGDAAEVGEGNELVQMFKTQANHSAQQEQLLRQREASLLQAIQQEEARWADLIARLDALTRGER